MSEFSIQDHHYMQRAISLAKKGHFTTSPNPRVGCVIVNNNKVVGEGYHKKAGSGHAEVNAIAQAGSLTQGATAYVTLEPCSYYGRTPPCAKGLISAGIRHVIVAMVDPNPSVSGRGLTMLEQAGISTQVGLLNADAQALNPGFIQLMTRKKPYVRCKLAVSLDGKTAMESGESKWITSSAARENVQRLRAQSCAVVSGASSVITDNAKMSVRWQELGSVKANYAEDELRQPIRVVIDSQNRLHPELAIFQQPGDIILVKKVLDSRFSWPENVEQLLCATTQTSKGEEKIDLSQLIALLAQRGINDVLIESGAHLAGAFIEANLVDELILFQAPKLMGGQSQSLVWLPEVTQLEQAPNLTINDVCMVGPDLRITARFNQTQPEKN